MDIDTALLRRTGLFQDMEDGDIRRLLDCLHCPVRRYGHRAGGLRGCGAVR